MEKLSSSAKTLELAIEEMIKNSKISKEDIVYFKEEQEDIIFLTAYKKEDIYKNITDFLELIIKGLGLEVNTSIIKKDGREVINIDSNNNSVLIGKNGYTLKALETISKQKIYTETGINVKFSIDIEGYRENKEQKLIQMAQKVANEVIETKIKVELDNLTSFERRVIHNALTEIKGIKTYSEGTEPNRYIVIDVE